MSCLEATFTLTPQSRISLAQPSRDTGFFASRPRNRAMSSTACLMKWLTRPGLAPCVTRAEGPPFLNFFDISNNEWRR